MNAAGWEMVSGGKGGRLRLHMLRAGIFVASVTEWVDRPDTHCQVVLRVSYPGPPGSYATEQTGASWYGDSSGIEADKLRLEAEIRRIAGEALAALGGAP